MLPNPARGDRAGGGGGDAGTDPTSCPLPGKSPKTEFGEKKEILYLMASFCLKCLGHKSKGKGKVKSMTSKIAI